MIKQKTAGITASLYDGDFVIGVDCIGREKCAFARTHVEPPEAEDECAFRCGVNCTCLQMTEASIKALRDRLDNALAGLGEDAGGPA